jgi:predicted DNA-binding protein (MmcQ/YjbR family)
MTPASLEKLCMSLRGVTRSIKWQNDLCYLVGEKMFCVTSVEGFRFVSFKTSPEHFSELIERNGIIPAPYSARHFWVLVEDPKALRPQEWLNCITHSYQLVFDKLPKKKKDSL